MRASGQSTALVAAVVISGLCIAETPAGFRWKATLGYLFLALALTSLRWLEGRLEGLSISDRAWAWLTNGGLVLSSLVQVARHRLIYAEDSIVHEVIKVSVLSVALCSLTLVPPVARRMSERFRGTLAAVAILFVVVSLVMVPIASPTPRIDVFVFQQEGAAAILHGRNPYAVEYTNVYGRPMPWYPGGQPTAQPYPPLSLLLALVAAPLGDVRWILAACHALAAFFLFKTARRKGLPQCEALVLSGLFAWLPLVLFQVEQAWTDTTTACALALFSYSLAVERRAFSMLAAGAAIALKQTVGVLAPLLAALWPRLSVRQLSLAALPAILSYAIFLIWDRAALWTGVVGLHAATPFREDANTLSTVAYRLTGAPLPMWATLVALAVLLGLWLPRIHVRARATSVLTPALVSLVFVAFASTFLGAVLVSKHAFFNYFYFVHFLLVAALIWSRAADLDGRWRRGGPSTIVPDSR